MLKISKILLLGSLVLSATVSLADLKESIADGSRLSLADKGFSITPIAGWKIIEGDANISLILESTVKHNDYLANIQINTFNDPVYMDQFSAEHFGEWFTKRLNEKIVLNDLTPHESQTTKLANGASALLFFYDFTANGKAMMQVNLVASSGTHHYILTYNDLKANFEINESTGGYAAAWTIMSSIETDTMVGKRYDMAVEGGLILAGLMMIFGFFFGIRNWRRRTLLKEFDNQDDFPVYKDGDDTPNASLSSQPVSQKSKKQGRADKKADEAKAKAGAEGEAEAELFDDDEWNLDKEGTDD